MNKRFPIVGILCLALTMFSLAACTNSSSKESETHETSTAHETSAPSWESRLTALFQESGDAGLTIDELTFFGTPLINLSLEDAAAIAQQQGFAGTIQQEDGLFSYRASSPDGPSPSITLYYFDGTEFLNIAYSHAVPAGEFWGRDETDTPVWVGIRDIYTYDTLENVLSDLKYSNSAEIAAAIKEILSLPSEEAYALLSTLHTYGFCCQTTGESVAAATDRLTEWRFLWEATDPQSQKQYEVEFQYLVEDDCLTAVGIYIE